MMAEINNQCEISDTVMALSSIMRYSLSWVKQYVTLREELENINNYVKLLNIRYDYRINLLVNIDNCFMEQNILKMSLQPIVENSFTHGIEPGGEGGTIILLAFLQGEVFIIEVSDDGAGINNQELEEIRSHIAPENPHSIGITKGTGIGLRNVNERIKLFFGKQYGLEIYSEVGVGTRVLVKLPYRRITEG